jgi:hypothetical protein
MHLSLILVTFCIDTRLMFEERCAALETRPFSPYLPMEIARFVGQKERGYGLRTTGTRIRFIFMSAAKMMSLATRSSMKGAWTGGAGRDPECGEE